MKKLVTVLVVLAVLCVAQSAMAIGDIKNAFNIYANPYGDWSFGQRADVASTDLTLYPVPQYYQPNSWSLNESVYDVVRAWAPSLGSWAGVYRYDKDPNSIGWTFSEVTVTGDIALAGSNPNITVARWTAPSADLYRIDAIFQLDDNRQSGLNINVVVLSNGVPLVAGVLEDHGDAYSYIGTVDLAAGDTVEFATYGFAGPVLLDATIDVTLFACPTADLTGDCFVDLADLAVLAQQWLTGTQD